MTVREAYQMALALINERDSEGEYFSDTVDFEKNLPTLASIAVAGVWQDDCTVRGIAPDSHGFVFDRIESLDDELPLHEATSSLLPYLLASLLLREEDRERSEYYRTLFTEQEYKLISAFKKARHTSVVDVYA